MFIERRCRRLLAVQWPGFLRTVFVCVCWGSWLPRFARIGPHQQSKLISKADAIAQCKSRNMLAIRNDRPESLHTLDVVWLESSWYKVHCTCILGVYIWLAFRGSLVFELRWNSLSVFSFHWRSVVLHGLWWMIPCLPVNDVGRWIPLCFLGYSWESGDCILDCWPCLPTAYSVDETNECICLRNAGTSHKLTENNLLSTTTELTLSPKLCGCTHGMVESTVSEQHWLGRSVGTGDNDRDLDSC